MYIQIASIDIYMVPKIVYKIEQEQAFKSF